MVVYVESWRYGGINFNQKRKEYRISIFLERRISFSFNLEVDRLWLEFMCFIRGWV